MAKIIVHGGAGFWKNEIRRATVGVKRSASHGGDILMQHGLALDAVEQAVMVMEDDPVFNAGKGSSLTITGKVEMDACVMDGRSLSAGAVALVSNVKNPISLARLVMDNTDHVLLAGQSAENLAKAFSLPTCNPVTAARLRLLDRIRKSNQRATWLQRNSRLFRTIPELFSNDTVGAVAVDEYGNFAAGASTGGIMMKLPGRIGDTPQVGAGLYADNNAGAAAATGIGEVAIRLAVSKAVCSLMEEGGSATSASVTAVKSASIRLKGDLGIIALDKLSTPAAVHNTAYMPWAMFTPKPFKLVAKPKGKIVAPIARRP